MESRWFLTGALGSLSSIVITLPVQAATLQSWQFDAQQNQLIFVTDVGVQPRAQMLFNPTRIVIDLPGTRLGNSPTSQALGGAVREVRAGQFDSQTARLVIELAPGYTVSPQAVTVQGRAANQWVVQLPTPTQSGGGQSPAASSTIPTSNIAPTANQVSGQTGTAAKATLTGVTTTGDGFLIRLSGSAPDPTIEFSGEGPDERQAIITLPDTSVVADLRPTDLPNYRYSIIAWNVVEQGTEPPTTRITLDLGPGSPEWRVLRNNSGVILLPPSGTAISSVPDEPAPVAATSAPQTTPTAPPRTTVTPQQQPTIPTQPTARPAELPTAPIDLPDVSNERIVVVLDPGHGGRDPGAVGINGLQEIQVIFPISMRVAELLEEQGLVVVMTRNDNRTLDLQPRVDIAERANADLFVSIHANAISLSRPDVNGIESYYASESGRRLAATLQASMLAATGMNDRGVKQARFYVIRRTSMPATLLEVGFVTGAQDAPRLADPAWRETMAQAIARGILQYIQQTY
jgi:N-acetylmuramoyl-L-alanine amidase